ncbi:hypothetical protein [Streptomyces sp. NRRL S-146]|nr:hypothetical protein [Streptomyces sp. NRRL S-146]
MTHFRMIKPGNLFLTHNTGLQIAEDAHCSHGQAAVLLILFGHYRSGQGAERLDAMLPRCVLAEMVGSLHAQILRDEGPDALQHFQDEVAIYADQSAAALAELHTQRRDCCEAGFRTNGAEHTCGRTDTGADRE